MTSNPLVRTGTNSIEEVGPKGRHLTMQGSVGVKLYPEFESEEYKMGEMM